MAYLKKFKIKDGLYPDSFDYPLNMDNVSFSGDAVEYYREENIRLWSNDEGTVSGIKRYRLAEPLVSVPDWDTWIRYMMNYYDQNDWSFDGSDELSLSVSYVSTRSYRRYSNFDFGGYQCYVLDSVYNSIPTMEHRLLDEVESYLDTYECDIAPTRVPCVFVSGKVYYGYIVWYINKDDLETVHHFSCIMDTNDRTFDKYVHDDTFGIGTSVLRESFAALARNASVSGWVGSDNGKIYYKKGFSKQETERDYMDVSHGILNGRRYAYDSNFSMSGNTSITRAELSKSVKYVKAGLFADCTSLSALTIPDGVTYIGDEAFRNLSSLDTLVIPASVTSVGGHLFGDTRNASGVKHVVIEGNSVFPDFFCEYVSQSNQKGYYGVESVSFPNAKAVGSNAFMNCSKLSSVTIPDVCTSIGTRSFMNCSGITSVVIPSSVKIIDANAFRGCRSLSSVTLSEGLETLGNIAFYACTSLTSIEVPSSVNMIDNAAFSNCMNLSSVTLHCSIGTIGYATFSNCESLTSIEIPSSVSIIDENAFGNCTSLSSIVLHDGLQIIGSRAFYQCSSLSSITIPDSVTEIDSTAFNGCSNLTAIYYNGSATGFPWGAENAVLNPS